MRRTSAVVILLFMLLLCPNSFATVLVFAPHPDDEALMFSGIIHGALQRGEDVKLVMATNGDFPGVSAGYARQIETVNAMAVLGLQENDIMFLGYPDSGLKTIYDLYPNAGDAFTSVAGQTQTYGNRGLGRADYHTYRFGTPGRYNRATILADLESILGEYQPAHIFVTGPYDRHEDHAVIHTYLLETLSRLTSRYPTYKPVVHRTVIHGGNDFLWPAKADPAVDFTEPPASSSVLPWAERESIRTPPAMRLTATTDNVKHQAILRYVSQVNPYLLNFVHRDEVFWPENPYDGNNPPAANAGDDQVVPPGTRVTLNGRGSHDRDGDTLTYSWSQLQGPPVLLVNRYTAAPSFTAVETSTPLLFQLIVSDGRIASYPSTVAVITDHPGYVSISSTVVGNGSIACTPDSTVRYNTATSCTATPAPGNYVAEFIVDEEFQVITDWRSFTYSFGSITADHAIAARFVPITHTVTFLAGANGSVTGTLLQSVDNGASTTAVRAVPATGYRFVGWSGPAGFTSTANPLTMSNVTFSQTITASFAPEMYTVQFRAGSNGSLLGTLVQAIEHGGSTTAVTAVPAAGYRFAGWTGSGGFVSQSNPLTVGGVTAGDIITAAFERETVLLTFGSAGNGSLSGETSQTVPLGSATTAVTALPASGYRFVNWTAAGGFVSTANPLIMEAVSVAAVVTANFSQQLYTVTPVSEPGGGMSPDTPQVVAENGTIRFTVTPAEGYQVAAVSGCGGELAGTSYRTGPITADCSVSASFVPVRHQVNGTVAAGLGTVTCSTPVLHGASSLCTIAPASGYVLSELRDNGVPVVPAGSGNSYAIGSVTGTHAVVATFRAETYSLLDAVRVQQQVLGKVQLSDEEKVRLDVAPLGDDGKPLPDGVLDVADVVIMLRKLVGVINW